MRPKRRPERRFAWYPIRTSNRGWIWLKWVHQVPGPWHVGDYMEDLGTRQDEDDLQA